MKNINEKQFRNGQPRRIQGQGMTEYIIVVALIALAAVVAVGYFGTAVQSQFVAMGQELVGGEGKQTLTAAVTEGKKQEGKAAVAAKLGTYTDGN